MGKTNFTEEELKVALKNSVITFNRELLSNRTDEEKVLMNKLILGFVRNVLNELGIKYEEG